MPKVLLLQFDTDPGCAARLDVLSKLDIALATDEPRWPDFFATVTKERPDAIVIACDRLPSYAREAARYLGEGFNTRNIPLVLVDLPDKEADELERYVRAYQPNCIVTDRAGLAAAVRAALTHEPAPLRP